MHSTLSCNECRDTEDLELQSNEHNMRVYLPPGEVEPDRELPIGFLLMADNTWFEEPSSGTVYCPECSDSFAESSLGLEERGEDTVRITFNDDEVNQILDED